jgi:hypothetical protein
MPYDKPEEFLDDFKSGVNRNARQWWENTPLKSGLDTVGRWNDKVGRMGEDAYQRLLQSLQPVRQLGDIDLPPETKKGKAHQRQRLLQQELLQQMAAKKQPQTRQGD